MEIEILFAQLNMYKVRAAGRPLDVVKVTALSQTNIV